MNNENKNAEYDFSKLSEPFRALIRNQALDYQILDYHKKVKLDHIKEKLMDKNLTIAEAFSFCGEDNRGTYTRTFKEMTGMTPTEYRNNLK